MVIFAVTTVSAQSASTQQTNFNLQPGTNTTIGQFQIDSTGDPIASIDNINTNDFGFPVRSTNLQFFQQREIAEFDLVAEVPSSYPPTGGNVTSSVIVDLTTATNTSTVSGNYRYKVPRVNDWSASPANITKNISAGTTSGIFQRVNITQDKNNPQEQINYSVKGNVSNLITPKSGEFTLFKNQESTIIFRNSVSKERDFGFYNGSIKFEDTKNNTESVDVNVTVQDDIAPSIGATSFPDVPATKTAPLEVIATDNIGVQNVTADIQRKYSVDVGDNSTTRTENVGTVKFSADGNIWKTGFNQTNRPGKYTANVTVSDASGNTANTTASFTVSKLDEIEVLNNNFQFEAREQGTQVERKILRLESNTPITLGLEFFQRDEPNSTFSLAVKKRGQSVPKPIDVEDENPSITIEDKGVYILTASSDQEEAFRGRITVSYKGVPSERTVDADDILFEGLFVDPDYPTARNWSLGSFRGHIGFVSTDRTVKEQIEFRGTAPADICKGFDSWARCIPNLNFGEYERIEDSRDEWKNKAQDYKKVAFGTVALSVIFFIVYLRKEKLEGKLTAYRPVKYGG